MRPCGGDFSSLKFVDRRTGATPGTPAASNQEKRIAWMQCGVEMTARARHW
jgi:hypothetical protein